MSGVLSAIIKFSKFEHQSTIHKAVSMKYASLENNIQRQLALPKDDRQAAGKYLEWVSHSFDELFNSSPVLVENFYQTWIANKKAISPTSQTISPTSQGMVQEQRLPNTQNIPEYAFSDGNMRYELERLRNN
jgi:hypothetical protein